MQIFDMLLSSAFQLAGCKFFTKLLEFGRCKQQLFCFDKLNQGVNTFKIMFRIKFTFGKLYFRGSVPVQVYQVLFLAIQFQFNSGSGIKKIIGE